MKFRSENQGVNTYLVYTLPEDESIDSMSLGMLTNNHIPGFAPVSFSQMDEAKHIRYNISSRISVKQLFSGPVNKKRLLGVLNGVVDALLATEEYMLDPRSVILDVDHIYVDVTTCETVLLCLPIAEVEEAEEHDITAFFKKLVFTTLYDQTENSDHVTRLLNFLNSSEAVSLVDFKALLMELDGKQLDNKEKKSDESDKKIKKPVNFGLTTDLSLVKGKTVVLKEEEKGPYLLRVANQETIPLNKHVFHIGKEEGYVDYYVDNNPAVSRCHAYIIAREDAHYIVDTNSLNHTYVDGKQIPSGVETKLSDGSKFRLANETFEFRHKKA